MYVAVKHATRQPNPPQNFIVQSLIDLLTFRLYQATRLLVVCTPFEIGGDVFSAGWLKPSASRPVVSTSQCYANPVSIDSCLQVACCGFSEHLAANVY